MLFFKSSLAFTPYRLQQKLQQLQQNTPHIIKSLQAHWWYIIDTNADWQATSLPKLETILHPIQDSTASFSKTAINDLPDIPALSAREYSEFWVSPRLGTISPWSSKAMDILENCLIAGINRIERVIHYQIMSEINDLAMADITLKNKSSLLNHDETVLLAFPNNTADRLKKIAQHCYDPLTESVLFNSSELSQLFVKALPKPFNRLDVLIQGASALHLANQQLGLALDTVEIDYLTSLYQQLGRNPTDVELMMFAQVNSEHCRHKIFNASWEIDGHPYTQSLFSMIRHTHQAHPQQALVAYHDNAAVLRGYPAARFFADPNSAEYATHIEETPFVLKVETHNHPTAISPLPGAATGSGGEIRDETATGRGAYPKAGLCGFAVSHLFIPEFIQPWEVLEDKPNSFASALTIMLQGPIGAAAFNNEFGRPNLTGFFRTFAVVSEEANKKIQRGYHKPIMIAGGIGNIRPQHVQKKTLFAGCHLIVLGGPAMAIGLGGGAASSRTASDHLAELDFASVQRANPEMQRRCQEVINSCWALGDDNPILSIHDVGAGGLSNALPELVAACDLGAELALRKIPNAEPGMSPLEIWCNEAQERFVLAVAPEQLFRFQTIAERERCLWAIVGTVTASNQLQLHDNHFSNFPVDLPLPALFEKMPRKHCQDHTIKPQLTPIDFQSIQLTEAISRVLKFPCVSNKSFLITIGDRTVTGLVARDQMVGPWQVPVADVAVTNTDYTGFTGEALAMGERTPVALLNPTAAARLAVGEAITNIAAAAVSDLAQIALSANWMAAANFPGEGANLYAAVKAVGLALCPDLEIAIPVGKDSLSMQATWQNAAALSDSSILENAAAEIKAAPAMQVTAPLSLIITAAAPTQDVRRTLTPELNRAVDSVLLLIDLGNGKQRLGGSVLAQVYQQLGDETPDLEDTHLFKKFFSAIQHLNQQQLILAYHDRSDGGLLTTLCEMMFASHTGLTVTLPHHLSQQQSDILSFLFNEELGAVIQVASSSLTTVNDCFRSFQLASIITPIAVVNSTDELVIHHIGNPFYLPLFQESRVNLQRCWSETSFRLQALRDHPDCAQQEFDAILDANDPGLNANLTFDLKNFETHQQKIGASYVNLKARPKVAILREQGVNGHREMAAAFDKAGFCSVDVHMSDILNGRTRLSLFHGLAAGGGFSYGDVLGAGRGWAQSILHHDSIRQQFEVFFNRMDTFTLGACNGCQMFAELKSLIPGAECWPSFQPNISQQFEARLSLVKIMPSPSIFLKDMVGSVLPVVVAHGEGFANFCEPLHQQRVVQQQLVTLCYVDHYHQITERYPANPNGSLAGITGLTTQNGRVMIVMPHPERVFRTVQHSWHPADWLEYGPWFKMFCNARHWLDSL